MLHKLRLLTTLLVVKNGFCFHKTNKPTIAIVGGGIGGASASHFLTDLFDGNLEIDLFEVNDIGGRLATIKIGKDYYEAGGSVIHPRNRYMQQFVTMFGMEHRATHDQRFGIWNGQEFVYEESKWQIISLAKLLYRYGPQPFRLQRYINTVLTDFEKIYALQDAGKYFPNVTSLLTALNKEFPNFLETSVKDRLVGMGFRAELIEELVQASLIVNYGQDINIQAFVGCVGLAGSDGNLWSIKGGNKEVPEHLISNNRHVSLILSDVKKVRLIKKEDNSEVFEVFYGTEDNIARKEYDIVIIATPLTRDQKHPIEFVNFPKDLKFLGEYHTTVATFVKGDLIPQYFGLEESLDGILSCNLNDTIINSVGRIDPVTGPGKNESRVWKIFSKQSLSNDFISEIFSQVEEVKEIIWKAYPRYSINMQIDKFKLYNGLYHVNAIEWVASAMEMSAIAGRNVAILAYNDFLQKCSPDVHNKLKAQTHKKLRSMEL